MLHIISGGAGFIARNLIKKFIESGDHVVVLDNLIRGKREYIEEWENSGKLEFWELDCSKEVDVKSVFRKYRDRSAEVDVWHLAANSDIPAGVADAQVDLQHTFMTTFSILQGMRECGFSRIHFASSSAIYGDHKLNKISENTGPYQPISNYGAMKLASEAQICAAAENFLDRADIYRFPNVVGTPATHGVILDFVRKLEQTPDRLDVLGDGTQRKAYLHVNDLVEGMLFIAGNDLPGTNIFNIGPPDDGVTVSYIAETVRDAVSVGAEIKYGQGNRGWVGDVPRFMYNTSRLSELGWSPELSSSAAIRSAVAEIVKQERE